MKKQVEKTGNLLKLTGLMSGFLLTALPFGILWLLGSPNFNQKYFNVIEKNPR